MRVWHCRFALAGLALGAIACGKDAPTGPQPTTIVVNSESVVLAQSTTFPLQVSVTDEMGRLLTGIAVTFASRNETIVTVSAIGMVTSVGPAGSTEVVISAASLTKVVPVRVDAVPSRIVVTPDPAVLPQRATLQLNPSLRDLADGVIAGAVFMFSSSRPNIATVSAMGLVTSLGPAGETTVVIQSGTVSTSVQVAVTQLPTSIRVVPNPIRISRNSTLQLQATILDAVELPIVGSTVTFSTTFQPLVTVSTSGLLTSFASLGSGSVTVTSGSLTVQVPFTVVVATSPVGTDTVSVNVAVPRTASRSVPRASCTSDA